MFTKGPHGLEMRRSQRGVPQGSPLSDKLFSLAFEVLLRQCGVDTLMHRMCYVDDLALWGGDGSAEKCWEDFVAACNAAGLA